MKSIGIVILTALLLVVTVAPAAAQGCNGCVSVNPFAAPLLFAFAVAATITAGVACVCVCAVSLPVPIRIRAARRR